MQRRALQISTAEVNKALKHCCHDFLILLQTSGYPKSSGQSQRLTKEHQSRVTSTACPFWGGSRQERNTQHEPQLKPPEATFWEDKMKLHPLSCHLPFVPEATRQRRILGRGWSWWQLGHQDISSREQRAREEQGGNSIHFSLFTQKYCSKRRTRAGNLTV